MPICAVLRELVLVERAPIFAMLILGVSWRKVPISEQVMMCEVGAHLQSFHVGGWKALRHHVVKDSSPLHRCLLHGAARHWSI